MLVYNVLSSMDMGNNTAIIIDGGSSEIGKGTTVLNDSGSAYRVVSYEAFKTRKFGQNITNASVVIHGKFSSAKMYV